MEWQRSVPKSLSTSKRLKLPPRQEQLNAANISICSQKLRPCDQRLGPTGYTPWEKHPCHMAAMDVWLSDWNSHMILDVCFRWALRAHLISAFQLSGGFKPPERMPGRFHLRLVEVEKHMIECIECSRLNPKHLSWFWIWSCRINLPRLTDIYGSNGTT